MSTTKILLVTLVFGIGMLSVGFWIGLRCADAHARCPEQTDYVWGISIERDDAMWDFVCPTCWHKHHNVDLWHRRGLK